MSARILHCSLFHSTSKVLQVYRVGLKSSVQRDFGLSQSRRWESTNASASKINGLVDQIGQLSLFETADLVTSLKVCTLGY